jgi:hypothetical protein
MDKTLSNQDGNGVQKNVHDVKFFGDPDGFQLICKASSESEGWMKSTMAMEIPGAGCLVQVTTQQRNEADGSYAVAEALTFVPNCRILSQYELSGDLDGKGDAISRRLVGFSWEDLSEEEIEEIEKRGMFIPPRYRK